MKIVYLDCYCKECREGRKVKLVSGMITCPECGTVIYKKKD